MSSKGSVFCIIFCDSISFYYLSKNEKDFRSSARVFISGLKVCLSQTQICLVRPHKIMRSKKPANCGICYLNFVCRCCPSVLLFALCSSEGWEARRVVQPRSLSRRESSDLCWDSGASAHLHSSGEEALKLGKHKQRNEEKQLKLRKWSM